MPAALLYEYVKEYMVGTITDFCVQSINSFHASGDFCPLLIFYANSLDPDKARHCAGLTWMEIV